MLSPKCLLLFAVSVVVCFAKTARKYLFLSNKRGSSHPPCLSFDQATFFFVVLVSGFVEAVGMSSCC